jgi:glycosyltransferase involved in cell wall biosynthesis
MPAHNEQENLGWLLPHLAGVLPRLARRFEVIIVDDGSTDGTGDTALALATELGLDLKVVRHEGKLGYGRAVGDGLRAASLEYTAFTDADGQLEPADLALLIPLLQGNDLVGGWRMTREDPAFRSVISGVFNRLVLMVFDMRVRDVNCALKIIRTERLRSFELESRSALINAELYWKVKQGGGSYAQVPVPHYPRRLGKRSGGRLVPILRASRELLLVRFRSRRARD